MIELTKENIDKAIVNKAYDMVRKNELGYIYTDETICTFNSMLIFRDLFNNKCKLLDCALEKLYYIADRIIQCVRPSKDDDFYNVKVITNPDSASVTINDVTTKERTLASGTRVVVVAKLDGYYDKTQVIESLNKDEEVRIAFTDEDKLPRYFTINVTTIPANAICKINNVVTKTANIDENKVCNIEVTAEGYLPYTTSFIVKEDRDINVKLNAEPAENIVLTVNPTPADAIVKIDGVEGNIQTVRKGNHTITVSKTGMNTYTLTRYFGATETLTPKLTITISVVTNPSDATVLINGTQRKTITGYPGEYTIEVSKSGYDSKTITKTYAVNSTEEVRLDQQTVNATITVVANPAGSLVKIDGVATTTKTVPVGTRVNVNVSLADYITFVNSYVVNEDMTVNVTLKNTQTVQWDITKQNAPSGEEATNITAYYTIEGDVTQYPIILGDEYEVPINKVIRTVANANGYNEGISSNTFSGNYSKEFITMELSQQSGVESITLTVVPTPSDATVEIDDVEGAVKVVTPGEHSIRVSKEGYNEYYDPGTSYYEDTTIPVVLAAITRNPVLTVNTTPNEANVLIDGENIRSKTVEKNTTHTVRVFLTGYATYETTVFVGEQDVTLDVELKNTKTVRYNVTKEDTESTTGILLHMLQNGTYIQIPIGEDIEVPYDTNITVRASAGSSYQNVTRTDYFYSNAVDAYETSIINIVIPKAVVPEVLITLVNVPYNSVKKANGVVFTEDSVHVAKNHIAIIDITCFGYTNYRIVIKPRTDKIIHVDMSTSNLIELAGDIITFKFNGSNREQYFTVDDGITAPPNQEIQISRGTHKIDSHIIPEPGFTGDPDISFTDIYNENTEFLIIIE